MKIAILGAGRMGHVVAEHLRDDDRVTAIVAYDVKAEPLDALREKVEIDTTTDLNTILRDPDIPLVMITATNDAHKDLAIAAIDAGKAVMCEKPIATTLDDARRIIEHAEQRGAFLQIGFELRYSKLYTRVRQWINEGLLGRIVNCHCLYTIAEYWGKQSWRAINGPSGGMFAEKLSHYVDLPRWWIDSPVQDVHSYCAPNIVPYFEIRDNYHTTCRYANGAASHLTFMMGPPATFDGNPLLDTVDQQKDDGHNLRYLVVGTHGAAATSVFDRSIKRWRFDVDDDRFVSKLVEQVTWDKAEDHFYFHNTTDQTRDIITRVIEGRPPATPARDAYETMKLVFAAEQSANEQRVVHLAAYDEPATRN
jgi:predicted dehydrogenase